MTVTRVSSLSNRKSRNVGWTGVALIAGSYLVLYMMNYRLPIEQIDYTSRIWNWSQMVLTITACMILIVQRRLLSTRILLLGCALAVVSTLSHWLHDPSLSWSLQEGLAVWTCFAAGAILFSDREMTSVAAFRLPLTDIGRSMILGVLLAIPLAVLNNLYFYLNAGSVELQSVFNSAFAALSPAIHEEIIFRFFVLAMILRLLKRSTSPRLAMFTAVFLAVVPHSLNHLPDLFLVNPAMGLFMLTVTSLLFGLPMAILQIKKNLESAIAFHWFIDFVRFLFGF
jgi:hypothetical protein